MDRIILKPRDWLFFMVLGIILALSISVFIWKPGDPANSIPFIIMILVASMFPLVMYLRVSLVLLDDQVIYTSLFRSIALEYKKIRSVNIQFEYNGPRGGYRPFVQIKSDDKEIYAFIKPYSKKSVMLLASTLIKKCPQAAIDNTTQMMATGVMPRKPF